MKTSEAIILVVLGLIAFLVWGETSSLGGCGSGCVSTGELSTSNGEPCTIYNCAQGSVCVGSVTGTVYGC